MATLDECRNELRSIIKELRDIEWGIAVDFTGIGQDYCSRCVENVAEKYEDALRKLNRVDQNRLADWVNVK